MPALKTTESPSQIIWGCIAIAAFLGRSEKSVFRSLEEGKIPGARKVAGRWALNPKVFLAAFEMVAS